MSVGHLSSVSVAWVKWLAIFGLCLAWGLGALCSLLFGGIGRAGHNVAEWALARISELRV
jgi:hypothetical protein